MGTEGTEVRCAWIKISFVTLGCSLSLGKFPFFYGVVMAVMALEVVVEFMKTTHVDTWFIWYWIHNMSWGRINWKDRIGMQEWLS